MKDFLLFVWKVHRGLSLAIVGVGGIIISVVFILILIFEKVSPRDIMAVIAFAVVVSLMLKAVYDEYSLQPPTTEEKLRKWRQRRRP